MYPKSRRTEKSLIVKNWSVAIPLWYIKNYYGNILLSDWEKTDYSSHILEERRFECYILPLINFHYSSILYLYNEERKREREERSDWDNRKTNSRRRHSIQARFHLTISQYVYPLTECNMFQRKSSRGWRKKREEKKRTTRECFTHAFYYWYREMYARENYSASLGLGIDLLSVVGRRKEGERGGSHWKIS